MRIRGSVPPAGHRRGTVERVENMSMDNKSGYGFSKDRPIELTDVTAEYVYLDSLSFGDGTPVFYRRRGSCRGAGLPSPVDRFEIYRSQEDMNAGTEPVTLLYLYGYADMNTTDAPEGFVLKIEHPDLWMMPPVWR